MLQKKKPNDIANQATEQIALKMPTPKNYFALNSDVYLVKGAKRGALYDLNSGDIYSIDPISVTFLEKLQRGISIVEASQGVREIEFAAFCQYLKKIEASKLGKIHTDKNFNVKSEITNHYPPILDFIWLEITENCNLKCLHCYSESHPAKTYNRVMDIKDWNRILKEAREMGCEKVQLIGGEPFICGDTIFELIEKAKSLCYSFIEIFTNATLLDEKKVCLLKKFSVHVAISLYGHTAEVHDRITQNVGSFYRTLQNIKILMKYEVPLRIALIIMKQNQEFLEQTLDFLKKEIGIDNVQYDFVRPTGRGCDFALYPDRLAEMQMMKEPIFRKISQKDFFQRKFGHNCFSEKLCITSSGNVIPCIMERSIIMGNVRENSLDNILTGGKACKIRSLTMDLIEVCRDCEYRYACFDCRPKAKALAGGNLFAKHKWCSYNPYEGDWEEKKEGCLC